MRHMEKGTESKNPLISVIMATFNEPPAFVREAVGSILAQTYRNFELLILDDSTSAETRREIDALAQEDTRVRVIRKGEKMGFVPALNEGLRQARGELIARMDGDDRSEPDRFEKQLDFLLSHPDIDITGGFLNLMNENGKIMSQRRYPVKGFRFSFYWIFRCPVAHPTVMIRRRRLPDFRYDESFRKAEDLELWLRLRNHGARFENLPEPLVNYRVVGDLGAKRGKSQLTHIWKARSKNFSWSHALFDIPSLFASLSYFFIPQHLISRFYKRENRQ